jgi:hypothetical protein
MRTFRIVDLWRPSVLATLLCLIYAYVLVVAYDNPLALVTLGTRYAPPSLEAYSYSEEGYDGQSVYYIARFAWEADAFLDVPAYRQQRILLPALGGLSARLNGDATMLQYALLAINLVALAGGTLALEKLLVAWKQNRWLALGYALSLGVFGSARLTTTETLAYGLVIVGILVQQRGNLLISASLFALAALAKETTLVFVAGYALWYAFKRELIRGAAFGVVASLPFLAWQMVLYGRYASFGIGSGGEMATSFELIPFMGIIRIISEGDIRIFAALAPILGLFVVLPTLWGLYRVWIDTNEQLAIQAGTRPASERGGISLWTILLGVNCALMAFVPFSTYREILGILRFIVGLQISVILYAAYKRQKRALSYSTLWLLTSLFVILSDVGNLN